MGYTLEEFTQILGEFEKHLIVKGDGEDPDYAISCDAYNSAEDETHIPEACNLAALIDAVPLILNSPESDYDSDVLSVVLICQLGLLREYIESALRTLSTGPNAKLSDKNIRVWANFLKHPGRSVVSHRCEANPTNPDFEITTSVLLSWEEEFKNCETREEKEAFWQTKKDQMADKTVKICLPTIDELNHFFKGSSEHIRRLIALRQRQNN